MTVFWTLLGKLAPLYLFCLLGWVAGRRLGVRKESIAPLLIYMITPLVTLKGVLGATLDSARLLLPGLVFVLCCLHCLAAWALARRWFLSPARNILAFAAGNANSGYFGLPAATALLGEAAFAQGVMISFGFVFYENTLGFYVSSRGQATRRESLVRVLRLPAVYAFAAGLWLRASNVTVPESIDNLLSAARGAYTVLGMMLIGLALADVPRLRVDRRFSAFCLAAKHLVWPVVVLLVVRADAATLHLLDSLAGRGLLLASALPLAANTVALATLHRAEPEKASVAVLLSTLLALLVIPAVGAFL